MKENFPPFENKEENNNERLLYDAEYVINAIWKKVMDVEDLPLGADLSYQAWEEDLKRRKNDFARILFNKARESIGEEKLRAAQTLKRLTKLINDSEKQELLRELMTNDEAVQKLITDAEEELKLKQTPTKRAKGKLRKAVDRLLFRDDDFDERLK